MIAPAVIREVHRLLVAEGLSQRKIARLTGLSRGTVGAIAAGKRLEHESDCRVVAEPLEPTELPRRCPGCGEKVTMPCQVCRARAARARSRKSPCTIPPILLHADEPIGLDLKRKHRARYEEVRRWRAERLAAESAEALLCIEEPCEPDESDLFDAFELDDDVWALDPDALRDALDWDTDEPEFDQSDIPELR